jgi:AraC-like DNA-binding protein
MLDHAAGPHVTHEFAGTGYVLGRFHCPADDPRWTGDDWIGDRPHVVLPQTPVRIGPTGGRPELRTSNEVVVYDRDTHYRRRAVTADGDRCAFLALEPALADEVGLTPRPSRVRHAPVEPRVYLRFQLARAALARGRPDLLAVDEALLAVVDHAAGRTGTARDEGPRAHRAAVAAVREILAAAPTRRWTLAELGTAVHWSPYCLARMFRRQTGATIAAYRRQLCLRASLPRALRPGADLARIASDHGFSSHSHYTTVFRKAFGCTPTQARSGAEDVDRVSPGGRGEQVDPAVAVDVAEAHDVVAEELAGDRAHPVVQDAAGPS